MSTIVVPGRIVDKGGFWFAGAGESVMTAVGL